MMLAYSDFSILVESELFTVSLGNGLLIRENLESPEEIDIREDLYCSLLSCLIYSFWFFKEFDNRICWDKSIIDVYGNLSRPLQVKQSMQLNPFLMALYCDYDVDSIIRSLISLRSSWILFEVKIIDDYILLF